MIMSLPSLDYCFKILSDEADFHIVNCGNVEIYKTILGPERSEKIISFFPNEKGVKITDYDFGMAFHEIVACDNPRPELLNYRNFRRFHSDFMFYGGSLGPLSNVANFPYINNQTSNLGVKMGLNRITMPQWSLGVPTEEWTYPGLSASEDIEEFNLPNKFITINDGWNRTFPDRMTKAYPAESWRRFVALVKENGIPVVQLGSLDNGEDYEVDFNLRGKTTFGQSLSILKRSSCHVDIEGGLVHAATALGTKCVVLHGPTNGEFFSYAQNANLIHGSCQGCWWLLPRWGHECIAKLDNVCMKHDPQVVMNSVNTILNNV